MRTIGLVRAFRVRRPTFGVERSIPPRLHFRCAAGVLVLLLLACAAGPLFAQRAADPTPDAVAAALRQAPPAHPRLFADAAGFAALKESAAADTFARAALGRLLHDADQMLALPPNTRKMEGRRLLGVSRSVLHRVSTLAMAYRLGGNPAHRDRCAAELLAAAAFTDWNPSHFLDVAEMSLALAVGYDWLYHDLAPATRDTLPPPSRKRDCAPRSNIPVGSRPATTGAKSATLACWPRRWPCRSATRRSPSRSHTAPS